MDFHSSHIPLLLRKVLSGDALLPEVNSLVRHAHHFALIRLKQLLTTGKLHLQSFPITIESAAIDCIAELFERDSEGVFVELEHYFTVEHTFAELSDDDLIAMFRSLVFTKLNDGIFALYRENDPVLSKILRNLKLSVNKVPGCSLGHLLGISVITIDCGEDRTMFAELTLEQMEQHCSNDLRGTRSIVEYFRSLSDVIKQNPRLRDTIPLIDTAVCIKRHLLQYQIPLQHVLSGDESLFSKDASLLIDETIAHMKQHLYDRYVAKNKVSPHLFAGYLQAIEMMTKDTFLRSDGSEKKYGEYLMEFLPELSYDEYRRDHRKQFEYMAKLIKKAVRERLKELL